MINPAGILTARHAKGSLIVGGVDLLSGLSSNAIVSFSWADNTNDQADGITVEIADPARTWMQTYLPKKGVEAEASIQVYNWNNPGDTRVLNCGVFWIDQIDLSGPPNTVSVQGTSVPVNTGIKTERKFNAWEDTDLMTIAGEIAAKNGLTLAWDSTKTPPKKKRIDQSEAPDLEFLRDKCKKIALSLKIFMRKLVAYSEEEYDAAPAVYTLVYGRSNILNYSLSSKLNDTYESAENAYVDPETGQLVESKFEPGTKPEGTEAVLKVNERETEEEGDEGDGEEVESRLSIGGISFGAVSGGTDKIKSKLREKNKREKTASFTVVGDPMYLSGPNAELIGFGSYDGKWNVESTTHDIGPDGYTTGLSLRYCLEGY